MNILCVLYIFETQRIYENSKCTRVYKILSNFKIHRVSHFYKCLNINKIWNQLKDLGEIYFKMYKNEKLT